MQRPTHLERISNSYNKCRAVAFSQKSSELKFLSPWKLSLKHSPPKEFGDQSQKLSVKEEFDLFSALHFVKYRIKKASRETQTKQYYEIYLALRNKGVTCNLPLVALCVKQKLENTPPNLDVANLFEHGYFALLSAVDCFDPWYGYKLSTYACNSIKRRFCRYTKTVQTESLDTGMHIPVDKSDENEELLIEKLFAILKTNILTAREKKILKLRFGFNCNKWNLEHVGNNLGISKERVRQVQRDSLIKLRDELNLIDL